jgi:Zn-dependent M32 family carboxypeptidase
MAATNQQVKLRADKAQFELEKELFQQRNEQMAQELRSAEEREKLLKETNKKILDAFQRKYDREKGISDGLCRENSELTGELFSVKRELEYAKKRLADYEKNDGALSPRKSSESLSQELKLGQ